MWTIGAIRFSVHGHVCRQKSWYRRRLPTSEALPAEVHEPRWTVVETELGAVTGTALPWRSHRPHFATLVHERELELAVAVEVLAPGAARRPVVHPGPGIGGVPHETT